MKRTFSALILIASALTYSNISLAASPLGKTCDLPEIYKSCTDAGYQCNAKTAVCEVKGSEFLGKTCDVPSVYKGCQDAGFTCNAKTAVCEK